MTTVSKDIEAAGLSAEFLLKPGQSADYSVAGTFTGFVNLERTDRGTSTWETLVAGAEDTGFSGSVTNESTKDQRFRFRGIDTDGETVMTGTASCSIADADDTVNEVRAADGTLLLCIDDGGISTAVFSDPPTTTSGIGADNGATVSAVEQGDGVVHKTILTLASTPVTVANTTGASFGGVKVYGFPEGRISVLGCVADLDLVWTGTDIAADGSGDFSMGTTITEDATLDGTDVDLLPSTALLDPFVLGVGTGEGALAAAAQFDGTTTPVEANLNIIIDDADVADAASDIILVSGTITLTWINLGDY